MLFYSKVLLMMMINVTFGFQFDSKVFTKMEKKKVEVNLEHIVRHLESSATEEPIHIDKLPNNGCVRVGDNWGCCTHIDVKPFHLHDTICANFSYLPAEYGIALTVTFGKLTIINETVSARNPPPICVDIPELKQLASICIAFHDLDLKKTTFKGCIALELRFIKVIHKGIELGCFTIPLRKEIESAPLKKPQTVLNITVPRIGREPYTELHSSKDLQEIKHMEKNGSK